MGRKLGVSQQHGRMINDDEDDEAIQSRNR